MNRLNELGWNSFFAKQLENLNNINQEVARVIKAHKGAFEIESAEGVFKVTLAGKYLQKEQEEHLFPVVGDWVLAQLDPNEKRGIITHTFERDNRFSRQEVWMQTKEQIIATNLDKVLIVTSCDFDFNLNRIERYAVAVKACGIEPVVILTKTDLVKSPGLFLSQVEQLPIKVPIYAVSAVASTGMKELKPLFESGKTYSLIGSSGVGKSTLINYFLGYEKQETKSIRSNGKGRHVTTSRSLITLPDGGCIIDSPGVREFQFWEKGGLDSNYRDLDAIEKSCRYRNCQHDSEDGCAIKEALESGELSAERYSNYLKIKGEQKYNQLKIAQKKNIVLRRKLRRKKLAEVMEEYSYDEN